MFSTDPARSRRNVLLGVRNSATCTARFLSSETVNTVDLGLGGRGEFTAALR